MPTLAAARPKVRFIGQVQALPLSLGSRPYISWSVSGPSLPETQRTSLHSLEGRPTAQRTPADAQSSFPHRCPQQQSFRLSELLAARHRDRFNNRVPWQFSAPVGTRTPNLLFRRQMLYPIELQAQTRKCSQVGAALKLANTIRDNRRYSASKLVPFRAERWQSGRFRRS